MKEINAQQLLNQIRSLNAELNGPAARPQEADGPAFADLLQRTMSAVNETQQTASALKTGFQTGQGDASLAEVMVAAQKADLSFRAITEVRNKLVTAYQEIMNMPV